MKGEIDFGRFGLNVENMSTEINIPYLYLPVEWRVKIGKIVNGIVAPNLQDMLRKGLVDNVFGEEVGRLEKMFLPEVFSPSDFIRCLNQTYTERIRVLTQMAGLIGAFVASSIDQKTFVFEAVNLLQQSALIEPKFFALSVSMKRYIDFCMEHMGLSERSGLSNEDLDILTSPGMPSFYLLFDADMTDYFAGNEEYRECRFLELTRKYFNNDEYWARSVLGSLSGKYLDGIMGGETTIEFRDRMKSRWIKKIYLLLERKIPFAEELDLILVYDNCFDKFFEHKLCFLHDLFLKVCLIDLLNGRFPLEFEDECDLENRLKEAMFAKFDMVC